MNQRLRRLIVFAFVHDERLVFALILVFLIAHIPTDALAQTAYNPEREQKLYIPFINCTLYSPFGREITGSLFSSHSLRSRQVSAGHPHRILSLLDDESYFRAVYRDFERKRQLLSAIAVEKSKRKEHETRSLRAFCKYRRSNLLNYVKDTNKKFNYMFVPVDIFINFFLASAALRTIILHVLCLI